MNKFVFIIILSTLTRIGTAQIINLFAGNGVSACTGVGISATSASTKSPSGIAIDTSGNVYFGDLGCNKTRMVNTSGIITTIMDTGAAGLAFDKQGNLYFIDGSWHVRKRTPTGIYSTVAGSGTTGFNGDGIAAITANMEPWGIAMDKHGNLFIADRSNQRIRMVNTSGIISTVAGTGSPGFSGNNGPATSAQINNPLGVAVDTSDNLYIIDNGNARIRKVSAGIITTAAGGGSSLGDGGVATLAQLTYPRGIAVDVSGNLYIGDILSYRIRMVNTSGIINTIAGTGLPGYSGDGGLATAADIYGGGGAGMGPLAVDRNCNLYFSDNLRVRVINGTGGCVSGVEQIASASNITVFPNPASDYVICPATRKGEVEEYAILDQLGRTILTGTLSATKEMINLSSLSPGVYQLVLPQRHFTWKLCKQ